MSMGRLDAVAALDRPDLLAPSVAKALANDDGTLPAAEVGVAEIDPDLADTAAFCEQYGVSHGAIGGEVRRQEIEPLGRAPPHDRAVDRCLTHQVSDAST